MSETMALQLGDIVGGASSNKSARLTRDSTNRRLQREVVEMLRSPPPNCTAWPKSDDLYTWEVCIKGPVGSPYEEGSFVLDINFPRDYPFSAPELRFRTPIFHCNIDHQSGMVYLGILKDTWNSAVRTSGVLLSVCALLNEANPLDPLVPDIAQQYLNDRSVHDQVAAEWTRSYAMQDGVNSEIRAE